MNDRIYHNDPKAIEALLIGHSVEKVSEDTLRLDDGTELEIVANEGCGGCGSGWFSIGELNGCENVITSVSLEESDDESSDSVYRLFVYADAIKTELVTVVGDEGNGYYGAGYSILVKEAA